MPNTINVSNARGPLRVSGQNARYFTDNSGKAIYVAGFHTWYNVQDGGNTDPPPTFDWSAYLSALQSAGCNCTKLWGNETARGWGDATDQWITPTRYTRTGPGNDGDGKLKFDLTQINSSYINRLVSRARDCEKNKIYFIVQLFQGWQISKNKGGTGDPVTYHPYLLANNINSVDGDDDNDGNITETHYNTAANNVLSYQQLMVDTIIDALNSFKHLLCYEISNEDDGETANTGWQNDMIAHINTYQASKPHQHMVIFTVQWPSGDNAILDASNADLVSYNGGKADAVHAATDPVSIYDTDHTVGLISSGDLAWIWTSFCEGHGGALFMDAWDGALYGSDWRSDSGYITVRNNLGYAVTLANLLHDLLGMTPQASLSSSGFCLAKDHATAAEYVMFYSGSSTFTLNLTTATGTLNVRWLRCSNGTVQDSATVAGGATRTLTPPWTGEVVAYVRH